MPSTLKRRFQYDPIGYGKKWIVTDTHMGNKIVYKNGYQECAIACYNLNKKYYRDSKKAK